MGTAKVMPLLLTMSAPAMLSMLIQALYNIVDSFFVGQISEEALRAVTIVFPVQQLIIAFAIGTSIGVNSFLARSLGRKDQAVADSTAVHGYVLSLFNWLLFVLVGLFLTDPIIHLFTDQAAVAAMAKTYMRVVTFWSGGVFVLIMSEKTLQATGDMIHPMILQMSGAITNIILDPIFIFGHLGLPAMGVKGAAIATVIGQWIGAFASLYILYSREHEVSFSLKGFRLNKNIIRSIYQVGIPTTIMGAVNAFLIMGLNAIIKPFSETAITALGVYYKLQSFVFMPIFGLGQGLMPIVGYNYGAEKYDRAKETIKYGLIFAGIVMGIGLLFFQLMPDLLLKIFNPTDELLAIGIPALRIISLCFLTAGFSIVLSNSFQALGHGQMSLIVSLLRQALLLLPGAYFLAKISLKAVWFAFPLAEGIAFIICIILFLRVRNVELTADPAI